jgi:hypothetical protein
MKISDFIPPVGPLKNVKELWEYINSLLTWRQLHRYQHSINFQASARHNVGIYDYLHWLYKNSCNKNILSYKGWVFPIAMFLAPKHQRSNLESVLEGLDTESDDTIDNVFEKIGRRYIQILMNSPKKPWDDPTFKMQTLHFEPDIKLSCSIGGYFNALKSCDILELELLSQFSKFLPSYREFYRFMDRLPLRRHLHSKGNPLEEALGRSPAIAISTLIIFREQKEYKALIRERSDKVAVHQKLLHVVPSFMFQPVLGHFREEYSVKHNIFREYLEEVIGKGELERPSEQGFYGFDFFYENPNLLYLRELEERGDAKFFFTGVAINLLNLRPEICTLLVITNPEWIINQRRGSKLKAYQLDPIRINWEFQNDDHLDGIKFEKIASIGLTDELVVPENLFKPYNWVPPGAAAFLLGLQVAREEIFQFNDNSQSHIKTLV